MVPAGDHDVELWTSRLGPVKELVERAHGGRRGNDLVEDVAGDEQGVRGLLFQQIEEPAEELVVLVGATVARERVAQVPVGGVDDAEGHPSAPCAAAAC